MIVQYTTAKKYAILLSLFLLSSCLSGCATKRIPIPIGEIPIAAEPSTADEQYGHQVLSQLSEKYELDYNDPRLDEIIEIIDKLAKAAKADKQPWHVYLFKDDDFKNAAATRGNHVFVWTGILETVKNEDELAGILAHELAHVLARHTDPDSSQQIKELLVGLGAVAAGIAVTQATSNPNVAIDLGNLTTGIAKELGSGFLVYPYSREIEHEADVVGMMLMAEAHFNPEGMISFWTRAEKDPSFASNTEFFSTHPIARERLKLLHEILPIANERYSGRYISKAPWETRTALSAGKPPKNKIASAAQHTDSFDVKGIQHPNNGSRLFSWRVATPKAYLFSSPDLLSKKRGEFKKGAVVHTTSPEGDWVELHSPDHGFLSLKSLKSLQ